MLKSVGSRVGPSDHERRPDLVVLRGESPGGVDTDPPGDHPPEQLAEQFTEVTRLFRRLSDRTAVGDLSNARFQLLQTIHARGRQPMNTIARAVGVTPRSLTDMVDALEAIGYLRRHPNPLDRRGLLLDLTDAGRAVVRERQCAQKAIAARVFGALDNRERITLSELLTKIAPN